MHVLVLEAIHAAATRGPVSIADVADELGIDRSGVSPMVADAVEGGHVRKAASPEDARRAVLTITDAGTDASRNAYNSSESGITPANAGDLTERWTSTVPTSATRCGPPRRAARSPVRRPSATASSTWVRPTAG